MKKLFFSIMMLVLVAMTGLAQTKVGEAGTQSAGLANTYWRNEVTGDWLIGFTPKHVIYQNKVWDIVSQTEKKDVYTLTLDDGTAIKVDKLKKGLR